MLIGVVGWIICGIVLAFIASRIVNLRGDDPRLGMALGGAGGLIGQWLYSVFSGSPVRAFNPWSVLFAVLAALAAMTMWHIIRTRGPHQQPTNRHSY